MRNPRGLWVSSYFTFPRRFEKLGQLIDNILKRFGYQTVRLEQFEWVQIYHKPPIKLVVVSAERAYASGYDSLQGEWTSTTGTSRAELTFFAPNQEEMEEICAAIREEIKSFREKLRKRGKTKKNKEKQGRAKNN